MPFFSKIFFTDAEKLILASRERPINADDKIEMRPEVSVYGQSWDESIIDWSSGKTLYLSLFKSGKRVMFISIALQFFASVFSFSTPVLINKFITTLESLNGGARAWTDQNILLMILLSLGLGLCGAGHGLLIQHYFYRTLHFFQISTNIVNKKIYAHALQISNATKQKNQVGEVVNLMSSDADAIGDAAITTIDLSNAILLLVGCSALLFYYMGWSAMVAIAVMIALIPITNSLAKRFMVLDEEMLRRRDHRMTIMTQVLNAIRVVKYFGWEKSIKREVLTVRESEIESRLKLNRAEILWGLIYTSISTVVLFSALLTHYLRGFEINLALVLTSVSIFAMMEDQFGGLSKFISRFINIFVSGKRITDFLKSESVGHFKNQVRLDADEKLRIVDLDFGYDDQRLLFRGLSFELPREKSLAVVGPVGAGKSTLLHLILNEMQANAGQIYLARDWQTAYLSQESFIVNATLRENIIFGKKNVSEAELMRAVRLASLLPDLSLFPHGLDTEIGEKGVNLSGGQKQRVCLARCVLADAELILLDDPLSAVDVRTENQLCSDLIFGAWAHKTRIVVTHRISQLSSFDQILFIGEAGASTGSYAELFGSSESFRNFISIEKKNQDSDEEIQLSRQPGEISSNETTSSRITVDEDRAVGSVETSVYKDYVMALGGASKNKRWVLTLLSLSAIATVIVPLLQKGWLTKYSSAVNGQSVQSGTLIYVYGAIGVVILLLAYVNGTFWMQQGMQAGRRFHDDALNSILGTEIRFFDSTPVGRILQRFSRDVESVDLHLPWSLENTISSLLQVSISFLLIIVTLPLTIVFLIPVLLYYYSIQNSYRRVAREVKRFDSLARSPRYAHFKETLQGLPVIRAFGKQAYFNDDFLIKLERSTQAFYTHYFINRWFSTRLPLVGAAISTFTVLVIVFSSYKTWISAGVAGLVTIYALQFWRYLNWGIRIFSDLESRMTSVERLSFYSQLEPEKEFKPAAELTPQTGSLTFRNLRLRYAPHLPYVLNDINFEIRSGAKVGIIGRTGSGKSTLFQAVYRFVHFDSGDILIDGRSIRDYSLPNLRKALAVIPQDPSLFMGSIRSNLDRYQEKTDAQVLEVLEKVGLANFVTKIPGGLDFNVAENGSNLSQGQRQLICLARALLVNVKIIFLDEATASVDIETDALIQKVIQNSLGGITLVTIAHRLSTLKGYDKIIELRNGRVVS